MDGVGEAVKVIRMTVWSMVRQGIGSCVGVYTVVRATVGHMTWRRVPVTSTVEGGDRPWRLATGGFAKFSSWSTKYVG